MRIKTPCFPFGILGDEEPLLFCFHHAGGNAGQLRKWAGLKCGIGVVPVEYAGHGVRMGEPFANSIREIADEIAIAIANICGSRNIYIYGHSLGTIIAFETVRALENKQINVCKLIVSGRGAPFDKDYSNFRTEMGQDALLNEMRRLGGMDEEMLCDERFMEYFSPIVMHDYSLIERYEYDSGCISSPVSAHCSRNDVETTPEQMSHWETVTKGAFSQKIFDGGHFFVLENENYCSELLLEVLGSSYESKLQIKL